MAVSQAVQQAFYGKPRDREIFHTAREAEAFKELKLASRCGNVRLHKAKNYKKPDGTQVYFHIVSWNR